MKRPFAIVSAVVLAAVATFALSSYVRGIDARALRGTAPVMVYVASQTIPDGVSGAAVVSRGMITRVALPRKAVTDGAITSLDQIKDKVTGSTILKGEQILSARFVAPSEARGILPIPADRQAMSVEVAPPPGVGGFVEAGDLVSIIAQVEPGKGGGSQDAKVQYLLQGVEVLAVGQRQAPAARRTTSALGATQSQKVLMTLAVTPDEAEKLAFALLQGQVWFTLTPKDQKPASTPGRTRENLFS